MKTPNRTRTAQTHRYKGPNGSPTSDQRRSRGSFGLVAGVVLCLSTIAATAQTSDTSSKTMFNELRWTNDGAGAQRAQLWSHNDGSNGFLVRSNAGYTTGLLSRENDYRAFVISGQVGHKATDSPALSVMERGTYWVQPAGTEHALTCNSDCLYYVEPEGDWTVAGPGITESNLEPAWISPENMPWVDAPNTGGSVRLAHVWGNPDDPEPSGFFLFFKAGFPGFPHVHNHDYDGVVLQGRPKHWEPGEAGVEAAMAGSHLFQAGGAAHDDSCEAGEDCVSYFRFHGKFDIFPADKN